MMPNKNKPNSKTAVTRVSKSGRIIKTPKAILTTSSDDAPPPRSSKKGVSVQSELQRLREIAKKITKPKNVIIESEETAAAAMEESFEDVSQDDSERNIAISTNIGKDARISSNVSTQRISGMQKGKPEEITVIASSTAHSSSRGISPSPPREDSMSEPNMDVDRRNSHKDFEANRTKCPGVDFNVMESLKDIVQQNKIMQEQLEDVKKQLENIIQQQKQIINQIANRNIDDEISQKLYEPPEGFPLETVEQFRELEDNPSRKDRKNLYTFLCNLGGTTPKEFLKSALKQVMTDKLVASFSWPGGKHSEKFGDTKVANLLYLAAKNCPLFRGPDTKTEFKTDVLELLRTTKQRYRNLLKRVPSTKNKKAAEPDKGELDEEDEEQLLERIKRLEERANLRLSDDEDFDGDYDTDEH